MTHFRRPIRSGSRSMKTWLGQALPAQISDLTPTTGLFSAGNKFFGGPFTEDVTILRTRGSWGVQITGSSATASGEAYSVAMGVGLTTEEAALAGAFPFPYDNPDWDGWFIYQTMALRPYSSEAVANAIGFHGEMEIDSKAMRKIQSGMVLALSFQMFAATGGVGGIAVTGSVSVRALLKTS